MNRFESMRGNVVAVVGAGAAGIGAAVAAAEAGARVVLVEALPAPGGMSLAANVHTICGLYRMWDKERPTYANPGVASRLAERLLAAGAAKPPVPMSGLWVLPIRPQGFAVVARDWLESLPEMHCRWRTRVDGLWMEAGRIAGVRFRDAGGMVTELPVAAVVDATGDAAVAQLAGAAAESAPAGRLQRPAYIAGLDGLGARWLQPEGKLQLAGLLVEGVRGGALPAAALGASFRAGAEPGLVWCTVDLAGDGQGGKWDPLSEIAKNAAEANGRALTGNICNYLCERTGDAVVVWYWPMQVGVRESRRLLGRQELGGDDLRSGRRFADEVAEVAWPAELRENTRGPVLKFPPEGMAAGVPAGAMQAGAIANLFAAGRCLSCDHEAQAAIRVIGMGLATGEAAGRAAAGVAATLHT